MFVQRAEGLDIVRKLPRQKYNDSIDYAVNSENIEHANKLRPRHL